MPTVWSPGTGPSSPASRSTASVMIPEPGRTARLAAIFLPSAEDGTRTLAGDLRTGGLEGARLGTIR